ncbi:hypothetical protein [Sphingobacterium siyangense]|uniref:hypothetical protein n=1 Tax=Sphingobacterium siyangense TaxID=459529 RepID=UPI003DA5B75B
MSHHRYDFSTNFTGAKNGGDDICYADAGNVRNLCFVWLDGRREFFNYAYLVSVVLDRKDQSFHRLEIRFTSHIIHLTGYQLGGLFGLLMNHIPRLIHQTDYRYLSGDKAGYHVTDILITQV